MATVQELKKAHQNEWVVIQILKENAAGPQEGTLLYHSTNREEAWRYVKNQRQKVYVSYAGPMLEEGYAAAF